jgi:chorismate dehydratase
MIIGLIDYINLLPFTLFIKKYNNKKLFDIMKYHRGTPRVVNNLFMKQKIQSGFLSSIMAQKYHKHNMGIIAKKEVLSVLLKKGENKKDLASNTSNILADILDIKGEVIIGDRALQLYFNDNYKYIDLASIWYDRYNLPFVFAIFCSNINTNFYDNLTKKFLSKKIKIPQYILDKYSKNTKISKSNILLYLSKIHYKITRKEKKSLKKFFYLSKTRKEK